MFALANIDDQVSQPNRANVRVEQSFLGKVTPSE